MKKIKYFLCVGNDTYPKIIPHSAENEEIAKREAYNGIITPYDDGEPEHEPTAEERIAELEEALNMILSGVTE